MIILRGWVARVVLIVIGVLGFAAAAADVLDLYIAAWKVTAPATLLYGALIWRFALPPMDAAPPRGPGEIALEIGSKLALTLAAIAATLGLVALGIYAWRLAKTNWAYILLSLVLLAVAFAWAWFDQARQDRRARERAPVAPEGGRGATEAPGSYRPSPVIALMLRWTRWALLAGVAVGAAVTIVDMVWTHEGPRPPITVPTFVAFFALLFLSVGKPPRPTFFGVIGNLFARFVMTCIMIGLIVFVVATVGGLVPLALRYWWVSAPIGLAGLGLLAASFFWKPSAPARLDHEGDA